MGAIARFFEPFHPRRMVSLVRDRGSGSAREQEIERQAAADVAALEQDDKYFGPDAPADQDELLPAGRSCAGRHLGNQRRPRSGPRAAAPRTAAAHPGAWTLLK